MHNTKTFLRLVHTYNFKLLGTPIKNINKKYN